MSTVTIHKAKTELSKLIARVEAGEEITILRRDLPVALLTSPKVAKRANRKGGSMPELLALPDDLFLRPLSEEELALWDGGK